MQFKVPQNVQMADKIVGPLTLKQLGILGGGGGFAYVIYVILGKTYYWEIWVPPVAIVVIITVLFAFIKIHNVSFSKFLILLIEHLLIPRRRMWNKGSAEVYEIPQATKKTTVKKAKKAPREKGQIKNSLEKLEEASKIFENIENIDNKNKIQ